MGAGKAAGAEPGEGMELLLLLLLLGLDWRPWGSGAAEQQSQGVSKPCPSLSLRDKGSRGKIGEL